MAIVHYWLYTLKRRMMVQWLKILSLSAGKLTAKVQNLSVVRQGELLLSALAAAYLAVQKYRNVRR